MSTGVEELKIKAEKLAAEAASGNGSFRDNDENPTGAPALLPLEVFYNSPPLPEIVILSDNMIVTLIIVMLTIELVAFFFFSQLLSSTSQHVISYFLFLFLLLLKSPRGWRSENPTPFRAGC